MKKKVMSLLLCLCMALMLLPVSASAGETITGVSFRLNNFEVGQTLGNVSLTQSCSGGNYLASPLDGYYKFYTTAPSSATDIQSATALTSTTVIDTGTVYYMSVYFKIADDVISQSHSLIRVLTDTSVTLTATGFDTEAENVFNANAGTSDSNVKDLYAVFKLTPTTPTVTIVYNDENGAVVTNPKVGDTLYAKVEGIPEGTTLTYKWLYYKDGQSDNMQFPDGTNSTYTLMDDAQGCQIILSVSKINDNGESKFVGHYSITTPVAAAGNNNNNNGNNDSNNNGNNNNNNNNNNGSHRVYYTPATEKADSPKTFDAGVTLYAALAVSSALGMGYIGKKKQ